ncbi:MAG: flippase-like domain-containing protein [Muribaculaceae bacterium]|nr:flippase-like domain-containing protein [Muribaculaceae bacterium]
MKEENQHTTAEKESESPNRRALDYLLRWGLPLCLTLLLVWYMFRKVSFSEMLAILSDGVDYWWILGAMGVSVFSHIFRAMRWRIQLRSLGIHASLGALCCSIFGCYSLNLIFPRLGEVWRCTFISRREKARFTTVLGSMVGDRLCDTLMVLMLTLLAFMLAAPAIESFMAKYPVGQGILSLLGNIWAWLAFFVGILLVWGLFRYGKELWIVSKIRGWIKELWSGFAALWRMKGKWSFLALTIAIWGCYFLQLYLAFFAFGFTRQLCEEGSLGFGLLPCLVAFVVSSIGMAIPSNGGLGPWNIAIIFGLGLYGIGEAEGTAFSMLVWSAQTVMLIILGIYTMIYISKKKEKS